MSDQPCDRLRKAMLEKGFQTGADLARRMGIKEVTVRAHLNGYSGITTTRAAAYAKVLSVTPEWLLYGTELPLDLPEDSQEAALVIVEYVIEHSDHRLSPNEKLNLVRKFQELISEARGQ